MLTEKQTAEYLQLRKSVPKEYHKTLGKIFMLGYHSGMQEINSALEAILKTSPQEIHRYCWVHEDNLEGG